MKLQPSDGNLPSLALSGGHLGALWALAFAWPLFDLVGSDPAFFVARGNTPFDVIVFALGYALVPPGLLLGAEAILDRISTRLRWYFHLCAVAVLIAVLILQATVGPLSGLPAGLLLALAVAGGVVGALLYVKLRFVSSLLSVLIPAPALILVLFLLFTPGTEFMRSNDDPAPLESEVEGATPIVLLVFDELPTATLLNPEGQIDHARFPALSALARQGTWYRDHVTLSDNTMIALPEILTGREADAIRVPIASSYPESLFTALGGSYRVHAHESVTEMCPEAICGPIERPPFKSRLRQLAFDLRYAAARQMLPVSIASKLPDVGTTFGAVTEADTAARFVNIRAAPWSPERLTEFLSGVEGGRTLSYIQLELPHEPWHFLPDGRRYEPGGLAVMHSQDGHYFSGDDQAMISLTQRHYLQTGYVDSLIRRLKQHMVEQGIWDEALVIVTADHGVAIRPDTPRRTLTRENTAEIVNPPLFIKYPHQASGGLSEVQTRTIDILPTILETVGAEIPDGVQGVPIPDLKPTSRPLMVKSSAGEKIELDLAALRSTRADVVRRNLERIGDGPLDRLGPRADLIGKAVPRFQGASAGAFSLTEPAALDDVDPGAQDLPAFVSGTLTDVDEGDLLAVGINGVIGATTQAFRHSDDRIWFASVLPDWSLRKGRNRLELFRVRGEKFESLKAS